MKILCCMSTILAGIENDIEMRLAMNGSPVRLFGYFVYE